MADESFDYVVVGGGSSGAALAARLAEKAGVSVCLVEAGGLDNHPFIHVPAAVAAAIGTKSLNWRFETVPQPGMNGRRIAVPRGKVLGGSGAINGMVYFRGHPTDFDDWADAGATGWSYAEVLPYFTRTENNEDYPASVYHGHGGPVNVKLVENPNALNYAFMDGLAALQFPACPDFNGSDPEGYGRRQGLIRDGRRVTTAGAMLRPMLARNRVTLRHGSQVARVIVEEGRATGVALADGSRIGARAEVVLCAGTVQTPQILMLSGIGPGGHLQEMGIETVLDAPGVGGNYHDHVACPVHMETDLATSYGISWKALPRGMWNVLEYLVARKGPFAGNVFESVAFLRTDPALTRPDVQFVFQPAKRLTNPKIPLPIGHGFGISPVALYPKSRGTLRLVSPDPLAAPAIDPQLLAEPGDIDSLVRAIRIARRTFQTAGFAKYRATEFAPGAAVQSDAEIEDFIRSFGYTVHHPCGTARMGGADAVVDPELRLRGIAGLRVADASVMPSIVGGNSNAACVMIAEKAADMMLSKPALPAAALPPESVARRKAA
ncbi:MAG: GMC family oxidoreductase N-terminal domain-containing protein [Sphingomonas sp.]